MKRNWTATTALAGRWTLAAAVAAVALGVTGPAMAQTAVEQRIQGLERELEELKRVMREQSETVKETREMAGKAAAGVPRSGNKNVDLKIYGQVNRAVLFADDGRNTDTLFVDNDMSSSRVGFEGKAAVTSTFAVGAKVEVEIQEAPSNSANLDNEDDQGSQGGFSVRKVEFSLSDTRFGKLTLGQQSEAHDGAGEVDISGTGLFMGSLQEVFGGGITFVNKATNTNTGPEMGDVFRNFDGSREDAIRYDTPKFFGFGASVVAESDDRAGVALEWGGKFADFTGEAMIGYQRVPDSAGTGPGNPSNIVVGSASVLHSSGLSLTLASGRQEIEEAANRDDASYIYTKLGYTFRAFDFGKSSVGVDYYRGENMEQNDDESSSWGVGFVQKVDDAALELYAGVRLYDYEQTGADFETIMVGMTGGRVKF